MPHHKSDMHQEGFAHQQRHWGQQLCKEKRHWNYSGLPRTQSNTNTNNNVNIPLVGFDGFSLPQGRSQTAKSLSQATLKIPMNQKYTSIQQHLYPSAPSSSHSGTRGEDVGYPDESPDSLDSHLQETLVPVPQGEPPARVEEAKMPSPASTQRKKRPFPRTTYSIQYDGAQNSRSIPRYI